MSPEAQRIAIAEACGWAFVPLSGRPTFFWIKSPRGGFSSYPVEAHEQHTFVPDYLNDLNAMHEAEKTLHQGFEAFYVTHIFQVMFGVAWTPGPKDLFVYNATAAQRAEAFLRTIGKWID